MSDRIVIVLDSTPRRNVENARAFCDLCQDVYIVTNDYIQKWDGTEFVAALEKDLPNYILLAMVHAKEKDRWDELKIVAERTVSFSGGGIEGGGFFGDYRMSRSVNTEGHRINSKEAMRFIEWALGDRLNPEAVDYKLEAYLDIMLNLALDNKPDAKTLEEYKSNIKKCAREPEQKAWAEIEENVDRWDVAQRDTKIETFNDQFLRFTEQELVDRYSYLSDLE